MIVKLIQNLEIKMESQINSLETRIEKMQERFKKDLEEIKKSQYIMNNAINEIKNTLDSTNISIKEAEGLNPKLENTRNLLTLGTLIHKSSSKSLHTYTETKLHPRVNKFQSKTYHANSPAMQEHSPEH